MRIVQQSFDEAFNSSTSLGKHSNVEQLNMTGNSTGQKCKWRLSTGKKVLGKYLRPIEAQWNLPVPGVPEALCDHDDG